MKLEITNSNYCATVVKIHNILPLENCDNVVAFPVFGYQAIVSKDTKVDDIGILFTAETQLSEDFCKNNNLFRHSELNIDIEKTGYIEDNRRIKAMKFRGHSSSALFLPLSSLSYLKNIDLKEGDVFDTINGIEICRKYEVINRGSGRENNIKGKSKVFKRFDVKHFPEHLDSDNYFRNAYKYRDTEIVIITQKLHGTSGRWGYVQARRPLNMIERILKFLGVKIQDTYYDYIAGSRKVIKENEKNLGFYGNNDIWTEQLEKIKGIIPKNCIIYGELIGWVGDKPIQKNYTYQIEKGLYELYVYRVVFTNEDGYSVDLSWEQVKNFCRDNGLKYVPEIAIHSHQEFKLEVDGLMDKNYSAMYLGCLPLDKESPCDEGVCVRVENGNQPYITKAKSKTFLEHETKMLDTGEEDLESNQSSNE